MKTALALVAAVALAACSSPPAPVIDSFTADTNPLQAGATGTLRWTVRNADTLSIDQGVGTVTGKTSVTIKPTTTASYTLTAASKDQSNGVKRSVTVTIVKNPAIAYFTAVPSQVLANTPVTYSWSVNNATAVLFDNLPVTGNSVVQNATATATHTLAVTGLAGTTAPPPAQAVVRVVSPPTISSFSASPTSILQGSTALLSWTGNGLGYSLNDGAVDTNVGAQTHAKVSPAATTTYTLTARGPAGASVTRTQMVTVTPAGGTRTLSYADPVSLPAGAALALRQDASSTPGKVVLNVVTTQAVQANALAFSLALDGSKVALDALSGSDLSPGFTVNSAALNPGTAPSAAKASLRTGGPLANVLTLGIAQKPAGSGAAPGDASIASGTILCTVRLVPAANAGPGLVFPLTADAANPDPSDAYKPYQALLRGTATSSNKIAVGMLTMN